LKAANHDVGFIPFEPDLILKPVVLQISLRRTDRSASQKLMSMWKRFLKALPSLWRNQHKDSSYMDGLGSAT
jgi:hypothetical protein